MIPSFWSRPSVLFFFYPGVRTNTPKSVISVNFFSPNHPRIGWRAPDHPPPFPEKRWFSVIVVLVRRSFSPAVSLELLPSLEPPMAYFPISKEALLSHDFPRGVDPSQSVVLFFFECYGPYSPSCPSDRRLTLWEGYSGPLQGYISMIFR